MNDQVNQNHNTPQPDALDPAAGPQSELEQRVAERTAELQQTIAILVQEVAKREQTEAALQQRVAFEKLITTISTRFINLATSDIDTGIDQALADIGRFAQVDRSYVFRYTSGGTIMEYTHEWCAEGIVAALHRFQQLPAATPAWSNEQLQRGEVLHIADVAELPAAAAAEQRIFQEQGIQSLIAVPMVYRGTVVGFLGFDAVRQAKTWPDESIALLRIVGDIFVNALQRKQTEEALQESRRMLSALMRNLPGMAYRRRNAPGFPLEFVSEGCFALTGHHPAELLEDQTLTYRHLIHPDDQARVREEVNAAVQVRRPFQCTYRIMLPTGEEKWVWEYGRGVYGPGGTLLTLEGFVTDVTERVVTQQVLEQRVAERTRELSALLTVQQALTSHLDPDAVLQMIAKEACRLTAATFGSIFLRDGDELYATALAGEHGPGMVVGYRMPIQGSATGLALTIGELLQIDDAWTDPRVNREAIERVGIRSLLIAPLMSGTQALGMLSIGHQQSGMFSTNDRRILEMFIPGAVIALENARLYAEAQEAAAFKERRRLARELHDAVTQTLFSAGMIAGVLPRIWERNPDEGRRRLQELRRLTRGALAEMRMLLLELRPAALVDVPMHDLLRHLVDALTAREQLETTVTIPDEVNLPAEEKTAFYRIAQEALNNVVKHARAGRVDIQLATEAEQVILCIQDNGAGFAPGSVAAGHLGLRIMRERAEAIGAHLEIESEPGQGTRICLRRQPGDIER